jgi:hypothetical protein
VKLGDCPEQWRRFAERYLLDMAANAIGARWEVGFSPVNGRYRGKDFIACPFCGVRFELFPDGRPAEFDLIERHP